MNKYLASSANPDKLGRTVTGVLIGLIPMILLLSGVVNIDLTAVELNMMIESVGEIVVALAVAFSGLMTLSGLVRKVWVRIRK